MLSLLKNYTGKVAMEGRTYNSLADIDCINRNGKIDITLLPAQKMTDKPKYKHLYKVTVRQYMTKKSTPSFDFMKKWNEDIPMPMVTMVGVKVKETSGMVRMRLHVDITQPLTSKCMKCGRPITNKISQYFGMGPECGDHNYTNPFASEEELKEAVNSYREKLRNITWEGWIIKSAILDMEELDGEY